MGGGQQSRFVKWAEHLELPTTQELLATTRGACKFYDRCRLAYDACLQSEPGLFEFEDNHFVACHFRRQPMGTA